MQDKLLVLCLIVLSAALLSYSAVGSFHYIENDPRFCKTCHIMEEAWTKWKEGPHAGINCHTCHTNDLSSNLNIIVSYFIFKPSELSEEMVEDVKISNESCQNCHKELTSWSSVTKKVGHIFHLSKERVRCFDCHGARVHRFSASDEECRRCHLDKTMKVHQMRFLCNECHEFQANITINESLLNQWIDGGLVNLRPKRSVCMKCHVEKTEILRLPLKAHAKSDCGICHKPHLDSEPISCTYCHEKPKSALHDKHELNCPVCHVSHKKEGAREICLKCHWDKSDHDSELECALCHR
jgi:nitrate/TMAO reductase-like tetraheme cytochrome c subunit